MAERNRTRWRTYYRRHREILLNQHRERERRARLNPRRGERCHYSCGRPAKEKISRVDPETWREVTLLYCGKC